MKPKTIQLLRKKYHNLEKRELWKSIKSAAKAKNLKLLIRDIEKLKEIEAQLIIVDNLYISSLK